MKYLSALILVSLIFCSHCEDSMIYISEAEPDNYNLRSNRSMNISQRGINLIKEFEGCRLTAYQCAAGVWTIGYGHTKNVYQGMTITQQQAEAFLREDLDEFVRYTNKQAMSFEPNQNQFDALVSFCYNCGSGNLGKLVGNGKNVQQVSSDILLYNKAGGRVLPGLERRRKAERDLFLS